MPSPSYLVRNLGHGARLGPADVEALETVEASARRFPAGHDLMTEGENPGAVHFIHSGAACRYKHLPDGNRAIVALLLPGDFCDLHIGIFGRMDHSIGALTECQATEIPEAKLTGLLDRHPAINRACLWAGLVEQAIMREWIVNIGRRNARQQLAHLFCELYVRLKAVGLAQDGSFPMPFTHGTLGDLLGLSPVHVQRSLSWLRAEGHVVLRDRTARIPDFEALATLGDFDPDYLHLGHAA